MTKKQTLRNHPIMPTWETRPTNVMAVSRIAHSRAPVTSVQGSRCCTSTGLRGRSLGYPQGRPCSGHARPLQEAQFRSEQVLSDPARSSSGDGSRPLRSSVLSPTSALFLVAPGYPQRSKQPFNNSCSCSAQLALRKLVDFLVFFFCVIVIV